MELSFTSVLRFLSAHFNSLVKHPWPMTPHCLLNCLGLPSDWDEICCLFLLFKEVFSINRHSKTTLPNWSECGSISVDYDFKHLQTPTTSTIERIVIMCTMICSFTTISNLTQLLLWRLTRPCSSDHQHKLPKHVWRTLFSKNCLNYCMVHARAPFPASSELLENIVIATGTQSFLTTWWFASPLCGLITTIKMRLEHQCFTQEEIQDPLNWHKCKGGKRNLYRV